MRVDPPSELEFSSHKRPLILMVDDVQDSREMYAEYFRFRGFGVLLACSGEEGIASARASRPDVILLDLQMAGLTGQQTLRLLRNDATFANVPMVALTAHAFPQQRAEALAAGFDAFVPKPCLPDDLVRTVEGLLKEQRESRE